MKCGLYELDITPNLGLEMPGYFNVRKADGIRERLYAHVAYFCSNDTKKIVIISCDVSVIPDDLAEEVREAISCKLDMKKECIMLVATHSHTAGPVFTWGDFTHSDQDYIEFLKSRMIDAALMAVKTVRDVKIGYAKGYEDRIAFYRDYVFDDGSFKTNPGLGGNKRPYGTIDPEVGVLRIDNLDDTPYGVIVNYTCHCDCIGGTQYSSDYPGAMKEFLKKVYGHEFISVFINGFCGNINHCDFENDFHNYPEHYRRMGRILAAEVIRTREFAVTSKDISLDGVHEYFTIPTREPDEELLSWADNILNNPRASVVDLFYANEAIRFKKSGVRQIPIVAQVLKIGDLAIYGVNGEMYVEFAKHLKKYSPSKYSMTAYIANGNVGYIPIKELFQPGIYEARLCSTSQLIPEAGYIICDKLLKLADNLWSSGVQ